MHELTHWKEMHLYQMIIADMVYMALFAICINQAVNSHTMLATFGFKQESYFISLYLFFKIWSVSGEFFLRRGIDWNGRRLESQADYGTKKVGMEKELRSALIRNYAANSDPLFVNELTDFMNMNHPPLLQRLKALKVQIKGSK